MKIRVKGVSLFEDLGNTKNIHGKKIKPLRLYRCSHLSKIDPKSEERLINKYHLTHVVDFRTDQENASFPELENSKINHYKFPALTKEQNIMIVKENRLEVLRNITYKEGGAIKHMHKLYHNILTTPLAIEAFHNFFKVLLKAKEGEAIAFHCTQGKDRTGVALMLLLMALDVDKKTIEKRYLSYNRLTRWFRFWVYIGMFLFISPRLAINLDRIIGARRVYIQKVMETLDTEYGGFKNYINNIVGISDEEIEQLKIKYLY